jgi:hypothetical protein
MVDGAEANDHDITNFSGIIGMNSINNISLKATCNCTCYNRGQWYKLECTIVPPIKVIPPSDPQRNRMDAHRNCLLNFFIYLHAQTSSRCAPFNKSVHQ